MNQQIFKRARRRLFAEKALIEVACLIGVAAVFLLASPLLTGNDPLGATTFTFGGAGRVVAAVAAMVAVAVICGALTVVARPAAVGTAMLIGLAGLSLHSPALRTLLWRHHAGLPFLYWSLAAELIAGAILLGMAMVVGELVRRACTGTARSWAWRSSLADAEISSDRWPEIDHDRLAANPLYDRSMTLSTLVWAIRSLFGRDRRGGMGLKHRAICMAVMVIGGAILIAILCRTGQRQQVLFAIFTGFMLMAMSIHQIFPTACSTIFWVSPIIVGLAVYALAASACQSLGGSATSWIDVPHLARALPVDWLTMGSGGGLVGYLVSARLHEGKILEQLEELAGEVD